MKKLFLLSGVALAFGACTSNNNEPELPAPEVPTEVRSDNLDDMFLEGPVGYTDIPLTEEMRPYVTAANRFAFNLFYTADGHTDGNMIISPMSVYTTLSMMANGDRSGEIRDEILAACAPETGSKALGMVNEYNALMIDYLPRLNNQGVCNFANAIMHSPGITLAGDFMGILSSKYKAEDIQESPAGSEGMQRVNEWVSKWTNGVVPRFLKNPLQGEAAVLNAAYFKAKWNLPFEEEETKDGVFRNSDGSVSTAEFLYKEHDQFYCESEGFRFLKLEYLLCNFALCVVLPPETEDGSLVPLSYDRFLELHRKANLDYYLYLSMPKFSCASDIDVTELLPEVGMPKTAEAGFDGMADDRIIPLNKILHSASLQINEKGTEVASATGGFMAAGAFHVPKKVTLNIDRPFYFIILECSSDAVLYMGKVERL